MLCTPGGWVRTSGCFINDNGGDGDVDESRTDLDFYKDLVEQTREKIEAGEYEKLH
jgi:hypothetical protein